MKGKVKCTCGWSWNKSDSSKKDMYICHECGRDNSNNMKNGGWMDNYNDSKASAPEGMVGDGFSNVGRNYSPAWGGQFEDGGLIPIAQDGRATRADSLGLYNQSKKVENFYNNKGYRKSVTDPAIINFLKNRKVKELNDIAAKKYDGKATPVDADTATLLTGITKNQYRKTIDKNKYLQRELQTNTINASAPMQLFDNRIEPKGVRSYYRSDGDGVDVFSYNTIANKPFDLLTPKEKIQRVKEFGTSGVPKSYLNKIKSTTTKETTKPTIEKREPVQSLTPLQPIGIQNDFNIEASLPVIRPEAQIPKSYDVSTVFNSMKGPTTGLRFDRKPFNRKEATLEQAMQILEYADKYNANIQEKYGPEGSYYTRNSPRLEALAADRANKIKLEVAVKPNYQMGGNVYPVNYVPQAAMGASIPGSPGFSYARTIDPAPSEGPYAKKTMASAKNGGWLDGYDEAQEGKRVFNKSKFLQILDDIQKRKTPEPVGPYRTNVNLDPNSSEYANAYKDNNVFRYDKNSDTYIGRELPELVLQGKPKEKGFWSKYVDNVVREHQGDGPLGAIIGTPLDAIFGLPSKALMYGLTGKVQRPSQAMKLNNPVESLIVDIGADPLTYVGGQIFTGKNPITGLRNLKNINAEGKIFSGMNDQLNNMAIQNTERYMAKRTPSTSTLSPEMEPYVSRYTKLSDEPYIPYQEDEYIKWFNEQKARMNPSTPVQDPRSILRSSSVIDINDLPNNTFQSGVNNVDLNLFGFGKKPVISTPEREVLFAEQELARANADAAAFSNSPFNKQKLQEFRPNQEFDVSNQQARFIGDPVLDEQYQAFRNSGNLDYPESLVEQLGNANGNYLANTYGDLNDIVTIKKNTYPGGNIPNKTAYLDAMHETTHSRSIRLQATPQEEKIASEAWEPMIKTNNFGMPAEESFAVQNELRASLGDIKGNRVYTEKDIPEIKTKLQNLINTGHDYLKKVNVEDFNMPALIKSLNKIGIGAVVPITIGAGALKQQREGGIIKDDRGQWDHPGEITEIGSNQITMEGVPYPVLGISDTGDTKLMKPGKNYKFKGKKVTEFPMAKNGLRQEQKSLQNLDNLLNFTNYNKPQPGGWLSKYE